MRNGLKRAAAFALTILMLLTLLPAALATESVTTSDAVVPGLSLADDVSPLAITGENTVTVGEEINYYTEVTGGDLKAGDYIIMDYAISEGDTFQGERGSDVSETEDGGSTSVSSEVTAD